MNYIKILKNKRIGLLFIEDGNLEHAGINIVFPKIMRL
jgi:hypothetical protein